MQKFFLYLATHNRHCSLVFTPSTVVHVVSGINTRHLWNWREVVHHLLAVSHVSASLVLLLAVVVVSEWFGYSAMNIRGKHTS